jgi:hypothetical protein
MCLKCGWCAKHKQAHRYSKDCDTDVVGRRGIGKDQYICPHGFWFYSCSECKKASESGAVETAKAQ